MTVKEINWAYPTSTEACRLGFGRSGVWTLQTVDELKPESYKLVTHNARRDVLEFIAEAMPEPWSTATLYMRRVEAECKAKNLAHHFRSQGMAARIEKHGEQYTVVTDGTV